MNNYSDCITWNKDEFDKFGKEVQICSHKYHELDFFSDEALIKLLNNYPRKWLQAFTMGYNPEDFHEFKPVHIDKASGEEIFEALQKTRIWVNFLHIDKYDSEYKELIESMYSKISDECHHIKNPKPSFSSLLLSAPKIQVYYHLDAEPNMLWHIRGTKKVWIYPTGDERFTDKVYAEEVITSNRDESIPYESWYDDHAIQVDLKPGQVLSWPQHSPHRIENVGFNVSLATSYGSRQSWIKNGVHGANYYFLRPLGIKNRSIKGHGLIACLKALSYYTASRLKLFNNDNVAKSYITDLILDNSTDTGFSKLAESSQIKSE